MSKPQVDVANGPTPSSAVAARCTWIESEADFNALRAQWNDLVERAPQRSIFLRHEWFEAAWAWRREDAALAVLCVWRADRLIGIAPLISTDSKMLAIKLRRLEFLSVPDTQFADLIAAPDSIDEVAQALFAALSARRGWDALHLTHLNPDSAINNAFVTAATARGVRLQRIVFGENPLIELAPDWATFYAERGRRLKKSNNLTANRLKKAGEIQIDWLRGRVDAETLARWQADIIRVSAASWKETTGLTLDNAGPQAFIGRLLAHAAENGWLSLWRLTLDGQTVATETQLEYAGDIFALRADYDQAQRELSVGSYLNWKLLEQMFSTDLQRYFLGPGGNAYKLRWTERALPLEQLTLFNRTLRGRLAAWVEMRLRPCVRAARARFQRPADESAAE